MEPIKNGIIGTGRMRLDKQFLFPPTCNIFPVTTAGYLLIKSSRAIHYTNHNFTKCLDSYRGRKNKTHYPFRGGLSKVVAHFEENLRFPQKSGEKSCHGRHLCGPLLRETSTRNDVDRAAAADE